MLSARHIRELYRSYVLGFLLFYFFYEWLPNLLGLIFKGNFFDIYKGHIEPEVLAQAPYVPFIYVVYFFLFSGAMVLGRSFFLLNTLRNKNIRFIYLLEGASHYFKAAVLMILLLFIFSFGITLFIIPGIIFYYFYSQSFYILTDNPKTGIIDAMRTSRRMMKGNILSLIKLDLTYLIQIAIAYLPLLIVTSFVALDPMSLEGMLVILISKIPFYIVMGNFYLGRVTFYEIMKFGGFKNFKYAGEASFKEDMDITIEVNK